MRSLNHYTTTNKDITGPNSEYFQDPKCREWEELMDADFHGGWQLMDNIHSSLDWQPASSSSSCEPEAGLFVREPFVRKEKPILKTDREEDRGKFPEPPLITIDQISAQQHKRPTITRKEASTSERDEEGSAAIIRELLKEENDIEAEMSK